MYNEIIIKNKTGHPNRPHPKGETKMNELTNTIITAKKEASSNAFLWLNELAGDCILWPSEEDSIDDDGKNAIERWDVSEEVMAELKESGELNEIV